MTTTHLQLYTSTIMNSLTPNICRNCNRQNNVLKMMRRIARRSYANHPIASDGRPFRMAVIGSGPAGFYTAYKVLSKIENAIVDMYEQLPVPYGLVRFGVAPDHPEVKNCEEKFQEVAQSSSFNFCGNITIGDAPNQLPLSTITPHYDAILFAYGASKDRKLGIPGEDITKGIYSARAFVGWYNGLPEYSGLEPDLTLGDTATVIGQGNVALDVARILLSPVDALRSTDITSQAIQALSKSKVRRVRVVGRRGAMQAAFTIKEVRELMNLESVAFHPIAVDQLPPPEAKLLRAPKRIVQVLTKGSSVTVSEAPKSWSLDFNLSPTAFNAGEEEGLRSISFEKMTLSPDPFDPSARASGTGKTIELDSQLAFRSIGYKSEPLPGLQELGIPFDEARGIIPNDAGGRVLGEIVDGDIGRKHVPGMYAAGWVKRGPTGVIASTMADAFVTAETIAKDWQERVKFNSGVGEKKDGWEGIKSEAEKRGVRRVDWKSWKKIDAAEKALGESRGKKREKFGSVEEMLRVLG